MEDDTETVDYFGTTFSIEDEDHTLANALRFFLNKNPHVSFCGYSMPHPSEELVNIRVQTTGELSATQALRNACEDIKDVCNHIKATLQQELDRQQQQQQQQQAEAEAEA